MELWIGGFVAPMSTSQVESKSTIALHFDICVSQVSDFDDSFAPQNQEKFEDLEGPSRKSRKLEKFWSYKPGVL